MWGIIKQELKSFFYTPMGYVLLGSFFCLNGLFLWVFKGPFNLLNAGFADLNLLYELNPWLLLFLVPAIGMRSFADELKKGTLELLLTKPLSKSTLITAKYIALLLVLSVALSLAVFYFILLTPYLLPNQQMDWGIFWGSFLGLFLLTNAFTAISVFSSTLGNNVFTSFIIALILCFFQYYGWVEMANLFEDFKWYSFFKSIALQTHYSNLNKGVIQPFNLVFLLGQSFLFLYWAKLNLDKKTR